ncbi:sensor histidine kinase [Nocardioides marmoribigeumensis]|uniref:histidine kinase n=1 Tax=Nocardioides marmoribigeumensis TaxID=433649 RepID=A0ABU2BWI9_9ACTN|nr:HAMP domain-containing sensor histidine kinase [Nocardioides marmoribigeumensis]MDR7362756.1 two-component system sensor histidine kinase MprB [Nocardioides marmoribigeumensis]
MQPVRFRGTLASRVSLLATLAVTLSVVFGSLAAYAVIRHQLYASLDASLEQRATAAASTNTLSALTARRVPAWALGAGDIKVAVLTEANQVINSQSTDDATIELGRPELAVARGQSTLSQRTIRTSDGRYRVAAVPGNDPGTALILAQSLRPTYDALGKVGAVLTVFGLLGIALAGMLGWLVARNGLRPVRRLTGAVEDIARTERLAPIEVEGQDEVARLAVAFNSMLAALEASRTRQSQLVADAGHELRTPLTALRTNLDLLSQADDPSRRGSLSAESRRELMGDLRFQIDELTQLIGDLTELAREQRPTEVYDRVDLAEVVERAVDRVRRRASSLEFDVDLDPWWVVGDGHGLERAVTNLLDNAAKWSPPLGTVTVRLRAGTLEVLDQGRGIAPEDVEHVFERFYRSADARTMPGSGLGLAIVAKVAQSHGGRVHAGSAPGGGAAFRFFVPGRPDQSEVGSTPGHGPLRRAQKALRTPTAPTQHALSDTSATDHTMES